MTSSMSLMEAGRPTASGVGMCGKTTVFFRGRIGSTAGRTLGGGAAGRSGSSIDSRTVASPSPCSDMVDPRTLSFLDRHAPNHGRTARDVDGQESVVVGRRDPLGVRLLRQREHPLEPPVGDLHLVPAHAALSPGLDPGTGHAEVGPLDEDLDLLVIDAGDLQGDDEFLGRLVDVRAGRPLRMRLQRLGVLQETLHHLLHATVQIDHRVNRAASDAHHKLRTRLQRPACRAFTCRVRRDLWRAAVLRWMIPVPIDLSMSDRVLGSSRLAPPASFLARSERSFLSCERRWPRRAMFTALRLRFFLMFLTADWMRATAEPSPAPYRSRRPRARSLSRASRASSDFG